jgi:hypothetical protein
MILGDADNWGMTYAAQIERMKRYDFAILYISLRLLSLLEYYKKLL